MNTNFVFIGLFALLLTCAQADTIAKWTFNGSTLPSSGSGTASLVGGATATFATGCDNDPVEPNSGWNTANYSAQGTNNKTAGVQFQVSTLGYSDIALNWEQRLSSTASKYLRLQISTDGVNFVDLPEGVINTTRTLAFDPHSRTLGVEAADNPWFAFRIVSEFESTALGGVGLDEYVTTYGTNNYGRTGTVRFDLVTVTGTPIQGANTPPSITAIPDQTVRVNQTTLPLPFTVSDAQDPASSLTVTGSSSDPAVIADWDILLPTGGADRTVSIRAGTLAGTATITLTVFDTGGRSASTSFAVNVLPANTVPVVSEIACTNTLMGMGAGPLAFTVGDLESAAANLQVSAVSLNPGLLPNDGTHLSVGGAGSNRTIMLWPAAGQVGVAPVRVSVSDGQLEVRSDFALVVRPSAAVLLFEPFSYADGPLATNSGSLWRNRSGTNGDCVVAAGRLELSGARSEDLLTTLANGPYTRSNGTVLYASFRFNLLGVPKTVPDYFAHFTGGSSLRGRVFAGSAEAEAWPGAYRLYVANGSVTNTALPQVLSTNTWYTAVTRYDVDSASTTLWLDPAAETDTGTSASDPQTAVTITSYGFRQDNGLGTTVLVDDLRVGLTFAAVTGSGSRLPIPLAIRREGARVVLSWNDPGFGLEWAASPNGPWNGVAGARSPFTNMIGTGSQFFRLIGQ